MKSRGKSKLAYEASLKNLQNLNVSAKEKAGEIGNKVSEAVQQGAEAIQSNKSRLKRAIDAGMEAYREESGKEKA